MRSSAIIASAISSVSTGSSGIITRSSSGLWISCSGDIVSICSSIVSSSGWSRWSVAAVGADDGLEGDVVVLLKLSLYVSWSVPGTSMLSFSSISSISISGTSGASVVPAAAEKEPAANPAAAPARPPAAPAIAALRALLSVVAGFCSAGIPYSRVLFLPDSVENGGGVMGLVSIWRDC